VKINAESWQLKAAVASKKYVTKASCSCLLAGWPGAFAEINSARWRGAMWHHRRRSAFSHGSWLALWRRSGLHLQPLMAPTMAAAGSVAQWLACYVAKAGASQRN